MKNIKCVHTKFYDIGEHCEIPQFEILGDYCS